MAITVDVTPKLDTDTLRTTLRRVLADELRRLADDILYSDTSDG